MSSESLIEEVGNLVNSSINRVAQAVQNHPHNLSRLLWVKVKREAPSQSRISLRGQLLQSCQRQTTWRPNQLRLGTWQQELLKRKERTLNCEGGPFTVYCRLNLNVSMVWRSWRTWCQDVGENGDWLTDVESKLLMDSAHDALLDRPNQFNSKHQLHKANGPTAVSVQYSGLIQLIVCD